METARAALPKPKDSARSYCISAWKNALVGLAAQTHKEADVNAMTKFVQDFATDLGASEIKSIATDFADAPTVEKILNMIPDPAERTKALNEFLVRKNTKQYEDAIKKADFVSASKALAQLPDGSDKISKQASLIAAFAGEGDFATAEKQANAVADGQARLNALSAIAYQRADAGDQRPLDRA